MVVRFRDAREIRFGERPPWQSLHSYRQQMTIKDAYGANVAFKTKPGRMANLVASRFLGEVGPAAPKPIAGGA